MKEKDAELNSLRYSKDIAGDYAGGGNPIRYGIPETMGMIMPMMATIIENCHYNGSVDIQIGVVSWRIGHEYFRECTVEYRLGMIRLTRRYARCHNLLQRGCVIRQNQQHWIQRRHQPIF